MKKLFCCFISILFAGFLFGTTLIPTRIGNTTSIMIIPSSTHTHDGTPIEIDSTDICTFTKGKNLPKDLRDSFDSEKVYKFKQIEKTYEYSGCKCTYTETENTNIIEEATSTETDLFLSLSKFKTAVVVLAFLLFAVLIIGLIIYVHNYW